jgi:ribosomal protein S18 acetylase RimI-like enzyme
MTGKGQKGTTTIIRIGRERLDDIEPLWKALFAHHASLPYPQQPTRTADESWRRRRKNYEKWLEEDGSFVLLAEVDRRPVGYAFVRIKEGSTSWQTAEKIGSLETLSVLPEYRSCGAGKALMDAVYGELTKVGINELSLVVVDNNKDAIRFYERDGFQRTVTTYWRRF